MRSAPFMKNLRSPHVGFLMARLVAGIIVSGFCVLNVQAACVTPASGLVSWWRGEGSGADSAGGNNIITSNAVSFASGEVGTAFAFDGTNTFMGVDASPSLDVGVGGGLTIEGWMNPTDVSRTHVILEWNNGSGGVGVHLYHSDPGIGGLGALAANLVNAGGGDELFATAPGLVTAGTFQHVALTYDKATGIGKLFYNGGLVASQNLGVFSPQTSYPLYFGKRVSGPAAVGSYYSGLLDEVSIYNRALADSEILAIFNAGGAGKCATSAPPSIITQPPSVTVNVGATVNLSVIA